MTTLPIPEPLPVVSRALSGAPPLPCPIARTLADLVPLIDEASRALRTLENAAHCVAGYLAPTLAHLADELASELEESGHDLHVAVGGADPR